LSQAVTTVAIAQPTFLPWLGWMDLADQVDLLIILDSVPFSKQSWQQRNRLRTRDGLSYVTVPVRTSGRFGQRIDEVEIASPAFVEKLIRTVAQSYARAQHFEALFGGFSAVAGAAGASGKLVDLNCGLIDWLSERLGINTPRVRSSQLGVEGRRGELVARLCEHVGARCYISPAAAEDYLIQDRREFDARDISVKLQVYEHPVYPQCFEPFMPYVSALDLLLNMGESALSVLRSGRRPGRELPLSNAGGMHV
jgi:hypothetical protein